MAENAAAQRVRDSHPLDEIFRSPMDFPRAQPAEQAALNDLTRLFNG